MTKCLMSLRSALLMRQMIEIPNSHNRPTYQCSHCDWHYEVRLFGYISIDRWFAAQDFELHECSTAWDSSHKPSR